MRLRDFPSYLMTTLPLLYFVLIGATYNGILNPSMRLFSVILLAVFALLWLVQRRNKPFASNALDLALPVWIAAFALSLIANAEDARRIIMGLWYIGAYCVLWYALSDMIARRALPRQRLVDALLIVGVVVLYFGYLQFFNELRNPGLVGLPRPVSAFGNPNTLAAFLIMLIPFAAARTFQSQKIARAIMAIYTLMSVVLLGLTFSRAAWLAFGGMLLITAIWVIRENRAGLRAWIAAHRWVFTGASVVTLVTASAVGVFVLRSLTDPSRSVDLRTFIYNTAINLFVQQPITGHGLFTFGGGLAALNSTPPTEPHSHAHNLILHIAAELGIVGLIALVLTGYGFYRAIQRNLRTSQSPELRSQRTLILAGTLAITGYGLNHLLDMPSMLISIFVTALLSMVVATTPLDPQMSARKFTLKPAALILGSFALLATGLFGTYTYGQYLGILSDGVNGRAAPVQAAESMQSVINLDPSLMVYHQQQGMLFAEGGDFTRAADSFARAANAAPQYAMNAVNQAAALAQLERWSEAVTAQQRGIAAAPDEPRLALPLAVYAENAGEFVLAREAYQRVLAKFPDMILLAWWNESPLRAEIAVDTPLSHDGAIANLLIQGDAATARAIFEQSTADGSTLYHALPLDALITLEMTGQDNAAGLTTIPALWRDLYAVRESQLSGDLSGAAETLAVIERTLTETPVSPDEGLLQNINYVQFYRLAIPYPWIDTMWLPPVEPVYNALYEWLQREQTRLNAS